MKTYSIISFFCLLFALLSSCKEAVPTCYYIDSSSGDDQNSGTSPDKAWKSFANVRDLVLQPGEKLLLKRGETYNGMKRRQMAAMF